MSKVCSLCGKAPRSGNQVCRRGLAKVKGGVGRKITGVTRRRFLPNLRRVRARVDGKVVVIRVCTRCIRSGKIVKP